MTDDVIRRMNYFDRQFLRESDFKDEQSYHLDQRRRHNHLLHTYGVAEGLKVSKSDAPGQQTFVLVSPGTAYDSLGREIVLRTSLGRDLSAVEVDPGPPTAYASPLYLSIYYDEVEANPSTDPGTKGNTRILEKPEWEERRVAPADPNHLLLAVITRDKNNGNITDVETDPPGRRSAGTSVGDDVIVRSVVLKKDGVPPNQQPVLTCGGPSQAHLEGTLAIGGGNVLLPNTDQGFAGNLYFGGVTDKKETGLRLFGGLVNNAIRAGFIDVCTLDAKDGLRIRVDTNDGGTERMRITAEGNVGIGTDKPITSLQIKDLTTIAAGWLNGGLWANLGSNSFFDGAWKRIDAEKPGVNLHMSAQGAEGQEFRFRREEADGRPPENLAVFGSTTSFISKGKFGIGTATPEYTLHVAGDVATTKLHLLGTDTQLSGFTDGAGELFGYHWITCGTTGKKFVGFVRWPSGNPAYVAFQVGITQPSDLRLKSAIAEINGVLGKVDGIRGVSFELNERGEPDDRRPRVRQIGVIAQEVEAAFPELVPAVGAGAYKGVDYCGLTAVLVEAVKALHAENKELKRRLEILEQKLSIG
ncbi:MAG: tail fiber domain-containing protein [Planctomycetota bacterium]